MVLIGRLPVHLHLMKHQTTLVYGRLNLATKHIAIISGMRIRIMKLTICMSFYSIKWRHIVRNCNVSKFKQFIENTITLRNIKIKFNSYRRPL
jgi:hypothetical protein